MVPMLFSFCVALWFLLRITSRFIVLLCSLSSCFFIPFSIVITSLREEGAGLCAFRDDKSKFRDCKIKFRFLKTESLNESSKLESISK